MGYGLSSLRLTAELWQAGYFQNFESVIELGSQDIATYAPGCHDYAANIIKVASGIASPIGQLITPEFLYKSLGFKQYQCIDLDGRNNALVFDLTENLRQKYGYTNRFDLVTNHGTSEHCFDQLQVFQNIHNLCKPGGIIIHVLPFYGYVNHGFYNYNPLFFEYLAAANQYQLIGMYLNPDPLDAGVYPYRDDLLTSLTNQTPLNATQIPNICVGLFVVLRKTVEAEFRKTYQVAGSTPQKPISVVTL
jgi:SAM-dependent methyltransferase